MGVTLCTSPLGLVCLRVQTTYVMLRPFAAHVQLFYLDRPRNTHTLYLQNRLKRRHAAMAYVCSSITASHTAKKEKNSVIFTPTFLFSSKKKFFSATAQLSPAESSSKGVFRRVLHHNIEFLSISTLIFYIHTLSTTKKFISMALCNIIRKTQCYGLGL